MGTILQLGYQQPCQLQQLFLPEVRFLLLFILLNTDENKKFNYELMKLVIEDFTYKSPEILTHSTSWQRLESILKRHIQRCDEIWKVDIVDLYNGKLEIKSAMPNDSW